MRNATIKRAHATQRAIPIAPMVLGNATKTHFRNAKRAIGFSNKRAMRIRRATIKLARANQRAALLAPKAFGNATKTHFRNAKGANGFSEPV